MRSSQKKIYLNNKDARMVSKHFLNGQMRESVSKSNGRLATSKWRRTLPLKKRD